MKTYDTSVRNNKSIYEFLYECIKNDILNGTLKPKDKLPSKRAFAANQGISVITVENTYAQLLAEGYIYSIPKSGFYVSNIATMHNAYDNIYTLSVSTKDDYENINSDIRYNLTSNHTPSENFPFSTWAKIIRRLLTEQNENLLISPSTAGVYELRVAISKHLRDFRGISCKPSQIIIGAGTEYLYSLIVQLFGANSIYGLENPSSNKIRKIYQSLNVITYPLNMDAEGVCIDDTNDILNESNMILQISPSHQFPLGIVTSISRRYELLKWASQSDNRYIIEDDYDSEFRLQGKPIPSLFSIDSTSKVIYFNTFTKSLSPTIRISYMVLPESILNRFNNRLGFYSNTVSNFEQYTLATFINEGYFEKHINRMRNHYTKLRNQLADSLLTSNLGRHITISEEDSGIHFIMKINTQLLDSELKEKAMENGIMISFISEYLSNDNNVNTDNKYNHLAIINYSGLKVDEIENITASLNEAWRKIYE